MLAALIAVTCLIGGPAVSSAMAAAPSNNYAPEVEGNPAVGETLLCYAGSWTGGVSSFTFQWLREGAVIAEGPSDQFMITEAERGDILSCDVIATNSEGSGEEESSNSVEVPGRPASKPESTEAPLVSGDPAVGEPLSCSQGKWNASPAPTFAYKWLRDGTVIASATGSTYTVSTEDQGTSLSCEVTATNSAGSTAVDSSNKLEVPAASAPGDEVPPEVLGIGEVDKSLTCKEGKWSGEPTPTFTYQWLRGGTAISSATAKLYTVQPADQGQSLSCEVTATNTQRSVSQVSINSIRIRDSTPENTEAPKISPSSSPVPVGRMLTCKEGTWNGVPTPTFTFQWLLEGTPIPSATERSYTVVREDEGQSISCEVTATNSEGVAVPATSEAVVVSGGSGTESKPQNVELPQVSGTPKVGATLTCLPGKWSGTPAPTLTYGWLRNGEAIGSATGSTYTVATEDQGKSVSCEVTATNSAGHAVASSANSVEVPPGSGPRNTELPDIVGRPVVGETLSCSQGAWNGEPTPTYTFQWLRDGADISSAKANSYVVSSEDRGHTLSCEVTATNGNGNAEAISPGMHVPGLPPESQTEPQVSARGKVEVGEPLKCEPGGWNGVPTPTYTYQWLVNGEPIASATEKEYVVVSADQGRALSCKVTATNTEGTESTISKSLRVPGIPPENLEAPHVVGGTTVGEALKCEPGVWIGKPSPRFTYQWLRDGTVISAEPVRTYTVQSADQGHSLSCSVIATNSEGHAEASSSNSIAITVEQTKPVLKELQAPILLSSPAPPPPARPAQGTTVTSTTSISATLGAQLARAARGARIRSLLKSGRYLFSFVAPTAGMLEVFWYQVPKGAHGSAKSKPLVVASSTTSFVNATPKTVTVRLTSAGRQLIKHGDRIKLTAKGVFIPTGQLSVTWVNTFVLSR